MTYQVSARVQWQPRVPERVVLDLDSRTYRALIACLSAHAANDIVNGRVVDCGTAAKLLDVIEEAVSKPGDLL